MRVLFDAGKEALLTGNLDWANDTIGIALIDSSIIPDPSTHRVLADIAAAVHGSSMAVPGTSVTPDGIALGGDVTFTSVAGGGARIDSVVLFRDTSDSNTSTLIAVFSDNGSGGLEVTGLPITPNGGDISVVFNPTDGIFSL